LHSRNVSRFVVYRARYKEHKLNGGLGGGVDIGLNYMMNKHVDIDIGPGFIATVHTLTRYSVAIVD